MPVPPADFGRLDTLLISANAGDEDAYRQFLHEAANILRGFARRRAPAGASGYDPEDLVQEILMAVHVKRHTWREGEPVAPWLFAIARYKAIDAYRRHGRRVNLDIADFTDKLADPANAPTANRLDVTKALRLLGGRQRVVVSALSLEGRSVGETAKRLGVTEGAVRVAFHRGLASIAAKFRQA
ncbi:sigma-70 family RNA polymerase sigma factor [Aurantimonas marianensis]|uniref:Sigma-70 family RNA polymerase sigma factor n=1 Tax=Aurantimonas marianensis TaxID=2920428 RepID=A0A9X2H703_9HYPH|nr:sigma-70 family RNA polymerase sigma factor [Aurantimonas marianensis]MCP3054905.1 sigma-70 family RNA polymerase sigma factor [Aurantimonas marianensis]